MDQILSSMDLWVCETNSIKVLPSMDSQVQRHHSNVNRQVTLVKLWDNNKYVVQTLYEGQQDSNSSKLLHKDMALRELGRALYSNNMDQTLFLMGQGVHKSVGLMLTNNLASKSHLVVLDQGLDPSRDKCKL